MVERLGTRPGPQEDFNPTYRWRQGEPLKPHKSEGLKHVDTQLDVIEGLVWVYPTDYHSDPFALPESSAPMPPLPEGITWEKYAASVPEGVVGIQEVKQLQGKAMVNNIIVSLISDRVYGATRYIDAQEFSFEEVSQNPSAPHDIVDLLRLLTDKNGEEARKVVLTRSGTWEPFFEGDSIIHTSSKPTNE